MGEETKVYNNNLLIHEVVPVRPHVKHYRTEFHGKSNGGTRRLDRMEQYDAEYGHAKEDQGLFSKPGSHIFLLEAKIA